MINVVVDGNLEKGPEELLRGIKKAQKRRKNLGILVVGPESYRELFDTQENARRNIGFHVAEAVVPKEIEEKPLIRLIGKRTATASVATDIHMQEDGIEGILYTSDTRGVAAELAYQMKREDRLQRSANRGKDVSGEVRGMQQVISRKTDDEYVPRMTVFAGDMFSGTKSQTGLYLDLGVTTPPLDPNHYVIMALLGAGVQRARFDLDRPRVGFGANAEEAEKQPKEIRDAYKLLESVPGIVLTGYNEPDLVIEGRVDVDVLVDEGKAGNRGLKYLQGYARRWMGKARNLNIVQQGVLAGLGIVAGVVAPSFFKEYRLADRLRKRAAYILNTDMVNPDKTFVGIRGHGSSNDNAIAGALVQLHDAVVEGTLTQANQYAQEMAAHLPQ